MAELIYGFDVSFNEPPPPPPDAGSSPPPPPDGGGFAPPEPEWEEPVFENTTIASVLWGGNDDWDRAVYKLSNGRTVFASKGIGVGQSPFDYEELRISGGGFYGDPNGTIVGHTWANNGDALILKRGEGTSATFHQQMYAWGNQGIVMAPTTQDVTSQIGAIEERSNSDIDGDGQIGVVELEEAEVEVEAAIYDNPDGDMDRSIYKMSDGSVYFAEQGLEKGDLPMEGDKLSSKDGSAVKTEGLVGAYWANDGVAIVYNNNGVVTQQGYKWGNNGLRESGKLRTIKNAKQIIKLEERINVDIDGNQSIGEGDEAEVEIAEVVYDNKNGDFDRSIYKMSDGSVYFAEQGLEKGDLPMEGDEVSKKDGSPIDTAGLVGMMGMRNGMAMIYYNDGVLTQQGFKWSNRGLRESGRLRNVTKQLNKIEERMSVDLNNDQMIGGQMDEDAEVKAVIYNYGGDDGFDRSLYQMDNDRYMLAEPGLVPGELPFEPDPLSGPDGKPYDASNAVGLMGMNNGFAMIFNEADKYSIQMFKWGGRGVQAKGRKRDITRRIYDTEDRADADFTNDGIVGKPHSGNGDPEISRVIFPGNDEYEEGLYQMQDGTLLFAEPDLGPGDSPFEDEMILGKNGKPYQNPNVVGVYPIRSGFSLVEYAEGKYTEQGFKFGRKGPQPFGKPRKIKSIDKTEKRIQFDINNDQMIAGKKGGGGDDEFSDGPSFRSINPIDLGALNDPLA